MSNASLHIIFWNARSIRNKFHELFEFISNNNVDICLLNETWLDSKIKMLHPLYDCIRYDRETRTGGGVAILIKKNTVFVQIQSPVQLLASPSTFRGVAYAICLNIFLSLI